MRRVPRFSQAARARLAKLANRQLTVGEWRAQAAIPLTPDEIEHTLALVHWFRRRYPTAAARFTYVRRAYARGSAPPSRRVSRASSSRLR